MGRIQEKSDRLLPLQRVEQECDRPLGGAISNPIEVSKNLYLNNHMGFHSQSLIATP